MKIKIPLSFDAMMLYTLPQIMVFKVHTVNEADFWLKNFQLCGNSEVGMKLQQ